MHAIFSNTMLLLLVNLHAFGKHKVWGASVKSSQGNRHVITGFLFRVPLVVGFSIPILPDQLGHFLFVVACRLYNNFDTVDEPSKLVCPFRFHFTIGLA